LEKVFRASYSDKFILQPLPVVVTLLDDRIKVEFEGEKPPAQEWFYGPIRTHKKTKEFITITQRNSLKPRLTISDPAFITDVKRIAPYAPFTGHLPWFQSKNGLFGMAAVKAGTILLAILLVIFALPWIVDKIVERIPHQTEVSMGKRIFTMVVDNNEEKVDTTETRLINAFYHQLSSPGAIPVHITVIDSHTENAISIPGGEIIVYSRIITGLKSYPELVALLGHESGHIQYRHSLKELGQESALPIIAFTLVGNTNSAMDILLNNASMLESLSFSREFESQADRFSYDWMLKNNINPQGMLDLFTQLQQDVGDGINVQFLSNHPLLQSRIDDVKQWMRHSKKHDYADNPQLESYWEQIQKALPAKPE
jgi:predicted Zn-dependent protease